MPAQACETLCLPVVDSLRASLAKDGVLNRTWNGATTSDELHGFLQSTSSKSILSEKIEFAPPTSEDTSSPYDGLKLKYRVPTPATKADTMLISGGAALQPSTSKSPTPSIGSGISSVSSNSVSPSVGRPKGEELPEPKHCLCPPEKVNVRWKKSLSMSGGAGCGLANMGNTCFLNSTLQCLSHTAPLVNYLLAGEHRGCRASTQFCMMCELQYHVSMSFKNSGGVMRPNRIISKLKLICASMRIGRQEDAHEFLRYVIEAAHKSLLMGLPPKLDQYSKETTLINQIFSGYHRSQVQCTVCHGNFNTYDLFMDISIDIKSLPSVTRGLEKFITPELLDQDNAYYCTNCRRKVAARKRFTIHKAPKVLTLQLKRFDYNRGFNGGKINKFIQYPSHLNLQPFMSSKKDPVPYSLYAVLVHEGFSCNSGHYYCFVKAPNGTWYLMNDSQVMPCSHDKVLHQNAYLLFYLQQSSANQSPEKSSTLASASLPKDKERSHSGSMQNLIGPRLPSAGPKTISETSKTPKIKFLSGFKSGTAVSGSTTQSEASSRQSAIAPHANIFQNFSTSVTHLPQQRDKVSFGIQPLGIKKEANAPSSSRGQVGNAASTNLSPDRSPLKSPSGKDESPKITMKIKGNRVVYNSALDPDARPVEDAVRQSSNVAAYPVKRLASISSLVPYEEDSSSSAEEAFRKTTTSSSKSESTREAFKGEKFTSETERKPVVVQEIKPKLEKETPKVPYSPPSTDSSPPSNSLPTFSSSSSPSGLRLPLSNPSSPGSSSNIKTTTPGKWKVSDGLKSPVCGSESSHGSINSTHSEWIVRESTITPAGKSGPAPGIASQEWSVDDEPKSPLGRRDETRDSARHSVPSREYVGKERLAGDSFRLGDSSVDSSFKIRLKKASTSVVPKTFQIEKQRFDRSSRDDCRERNVSRQERREGDDFPHNSRPNSPQRHSRHNSTDLYPRLPNSERPSRHASPERHFRGSSRQDSPTRRSEKHRPRYESPKSGHRLSPSRSRRSSASPCRIGKRRDSSRDRSYANKEVSRKKRHSSTESETSSAKKRRSDKQYPDSTHASTTEDERVEKKKKKKKEKKKKKKREKESKYEWVEKTKESCVTKVKNNNGEKVKITETKEHIVRHKPKGNEDALTRPEKPTKLSPTSVPTKIWDQPMFQKNKSQKVESGSTTKNVGTEKKESVWDFFSKNRGIQGYGGKTVNSWDDKPSKHQEVKNAPDNNCSSDEEMDRGKVKKVKKKIVPNVANFNFNPFQKHYENKSRSTSISATSFSYGGLT